MNDELKMENVNQIDLDCDIELDDDDFGGIGDIKVSAPKPINTMSKKEIEDSGEERIIDKHVGYCADFSDDDDVKFDEVEEPIKTISANVTVNGDINIETNFNSQAADMNAYSSICDLLSDDVPYDDTDDDYVALKNESFVEKDETESFKNDIKESRTIDGNVDDDYLDTLAKKHEKTNGKGAYNSFMHFAGDPKAEMDMLNHDLGSDNVVSNGFTADGGSISGSASTAVSAGDSGACCEELVETESIDYKELFEKLLALIGFEVINNSDDFTVIDNITDQEFICNDKEEVMSKLKPYVDDCLCIPLEVATNTEPKDYKGWCDWYTEENKAKYPKLASDIKMCDMLANHNKECF